MSSPSPLLNSPTFDQVIQDLNPSSFLVIIQRRLLARDVSPPPTCDDIWLEALGRAWQDRHSCEWRGIKSYRSWMLTVIDYRIADAKKRQQTQKRGTPTALFSEATHSDEDSFCLPGVTSTTPSQIAIYREQSTMMEATLATLPEDVAHIVYMRLFEQRTVDDIAELLTLSQSAVKHRIRKGVALYRERLQDVLLSTWKRPGADGTDTSSTNAA